MTCNDMYEINKYNITNNETGITNYQENVLFVAISEVIMIIVLFILM